MRNSILIVSVLFAVAWIGEAKWLVCYYNSEGALREGQAAFRSADFEAALPLCTHLIYGYAGINPDTYEITPLHKDLDLPAGRDNYRTITKLKTRYPGLKVLLSLGGGADPNKDTYLTLLESAEARTSFVNSVHSFLRIYGFDGLDLGWEFPETKPKRIRGAIKKFFHGFKKLFGSTKIDDKDEEHRDQYTALVKQLKPVLKLDNLLLSISVIPNVNSSIYYDVQKLTSEIDFVNLHAYDFYTPERNPYEADYTAPLFELIDRKPDANGNAQVKYWLDRGMPPSKINLGIPAHARTFKMTEDSSVSGVPPLSIDGPGEAGAYTKTEGLLSYAEVCTKINSPVSAKGGAAKLRKIGDPTKRYEDSFIYYPDLTGRFGCYAFRLPDENGEHGLWAGYECQEAIQAKVSYVKQKNLGGIAFVDLTMDDFKGLCEAKKYPLLSTARQNL